MNEVSYDFAGVAAEGPYGFKNSREDVMRPQFPGFDKLNQNDARMVVDVQMGLRKQCIVHVPGQAILIDHHPAQWVDDATGQGWGYVVRRVRSNRIPLEAAQSSAKQDASRIAWERERSLFLDERSRMDQELARARDERAELAEKSRRLEIELREERDRGRRSQQDRGHQNDLAKQVAELESTCVDLKGQLAEAHDRAAAEQQKSEMLRRDLEQSTRSQASEIKRQKLEYEQAAGRQEKLGAEKQTATAAELRDWQARYMALDQELRAERDKSHIYVPGMHPETVGTSMTASSRGTLIRVILIWAIAGLLLACLLLPSLR